MAKNPPKPDGGAAAELLFHKWLLQKRWTVHRARTVRMPLHNQMRPPFCPKCRKGTPVTVNMTTDIFGVFDFLAFDGDEMWACQVTTHEGIRARKRKIEAKGPYPSMLKVVIVTHQPGEMAGRKRLHYWKIHPYSNGEWQVPFTLQFDRSLLSKTSLKAIEGLADPAPEMAEPPF